MVYIERGVLESDLERLLERDMAIHAAVKGGERRRSVARRHGIAVVDVDIVVRRIDASARAIARASKPPFRPHVPHGAVGWSARLRNCLLLDLGVPEDRLRDPTYLAEVLSRRDIMHAPRMDVGSVRRVEEFLVAHGLTLRDR